MRCILLLSFASSQIWACVCGAHPSVKQAWERSPVVLSGSVKIAIPNSAMTSQVVAIQAEESFKGSFKGEPFFLLQPGHDCAPKFKTGERVLLDLNRSFTGLWEAFGCGRTQPIESAADDLQFLHALPGSASKNRIAGVVAQYENSVSEGFKRMGGISKMRVHIRSEANSIEAITDDHGVYEVYGLPPGNYRIVIDIPKGLRIYFPMIAGGEGRRNRLEDLRATEPVVAIGAATTADVDFVLMVDNQISGRVVDSRGKPLKDVCLQLQPSSGEASRYFYVPKFSEVDGSYVLKDMPPGQYLITAEPWAKGSPQEPKLFYPGTAERNSAEVVSIGSGEHLAGFDIRIPK
jgi:hypothetical protein